VWGTFFTKGKIQGIGAGSNHGRGVKVKHSKKEEIQRIVPTSPKEAYTCKIKARVRGKTGHRLE